MLNEVTFPSIPTLAFAQPVRWPAGICPVEFFGIGHWGNDAYHSTYSEAERNFAHAFLGERSAALSYSKRLGKTYRSASPIGVERSDSPTPEIKELGQEIDRGELRSFEARIGRPVRLRSPFVRIPSVQRPGITGTISDASVETTETGVR